MNNSNRAGSIIFILAMLLAACTLPSTPTVAPLATENPLSATPAAPERLPFEGMWLSEGEAPEILVFTKDSMYRVETDQVNPDQPYTREQFAKIVSYDLENNHISLRTQWIRAAGRMSGFDAPNFTFTYRIDGDTLQIGTGWEGEFATETDPLVYYRK
jgi:hypothetical protein